jgi:hypothetical protein
MAASRPVERRQPMATEQPNVLLVMADDIGWFDVGAYHHGIMGAPTPNIDRIAAEGAFDRQLRPGQLHGRAGGVHHRADPDADRADHSGLARGSPGHPTRGPDHARHRPASTPRQWSKRCSRPPPSAKETSNGGRQGMIDDMLAGSSRR